jgi:hypothetical protein
MGAAGMTKDRIEVDTGTTDRVALIELNSSETRNFSRICGASRTPDINPGLCGAGAETIANNAVGVTR